MIFSRAFVTLRLYVVFIIPKRSLDLLSGFGRKNMTVAFSTLLAKSPLDSVMACHAKFRSKYSFLADSTMKTRMLSSNQYFMTLCVTSNCHVFYFPRDTNGKIGGHEQIKLSWKNEHMSKHKKKR